ncbi:MAG: CARDB domain-containing protein, partial [Armatimonadota bacterium]|nr:CARDB domain-containing protein [Armatimonadota bacterium]
TARLRNNGGRLYTSAWIAFFADNVRFTSEPTSGVLESGSEQSVTVHRAAAAGMQGYRAKVDPDDLITETSETNNEAVLALPSPVLSPNLVALELIVSPEKPVAGGYATLSARVRNAGPGDQGGGFWVEFAADGVALGRHYYSNALQSGTEVVVRGPTWKAQAGPHNLEAWVDAGNEVAETNESDNQVQKGLTLAAPDLTIAEAAVVTPPMIGGQAVVRATVRNSSTSDVGRFAIGMKAGNEVLVSRYVSQLAASSTTSVDLVWTVARSEAVEATLVADLNQDVVESNEANNALPLSLPAAPLPDLVVSDLEMKPATPVAGEWVQVQARLRNAGGAFVGAIPVRFVLNGVGEVARVFQVST